jgi:membrane fusion protein (multidrug efflux system)
MMDHVKQTEVLRDAEDGRGGALASGAPQQAVSRPGRRKPRARRWAIAGVALAAAGGVAAWGIWERQSAVADLGQTAGAASIPKVALVSPQHGPTSRSLTLPGQTQAWYQAPIYAQVTGYVTKWDKDYGAAVKKGDVLATIETPDLDQELQQARAELEVARSKAALARVTAQRWQKLSGTQAVSQETVDVNVADAKSAQASVQAAQFNVARFEAQEAFKLVVSPFDGVVTSRSTDIGSFVNAAGGTAQQKGRTQELFTVADVHEIRVFVSVPQDYSASIKPGLTASITLPQFPDRIFKANFITSAKSFDANARTVLTELTIPNPDGEVWPGAYAEVRFEVPTDPRILIIPEQSLLFRAQGLQVALVGPDNKVHLQNIKIGLNLGGTVQVVDGLKPTDRLIDNPSDGLLEGQQVDVVQPSAQAPDDASVASNGSAQPAGK